MDYANLLTEKILPKRMAFSPGTHCIGNYVSCLDAGCHIRGAQMKQKTV